MLRYEYEVEFTVIYGALDADRVAQFEILPTAGGYHGQTLSVAARDGQEGVRPVSAWRQGAGGLINVSVPRTFSDITVVALLEVRRL